jgi:hypothetical protein
MSVSVFVVALFALSMAPSAESLQDGSFSPTGQAKCSQKARRQCEGRASERAQDPALIGSILCRYGMVLVARGKLELCVEPERQLPR